MAAVAAAAAQAAVQAAQLAIQQQNIILLQLIQQQNTLCDHVTQSSVKKPDKCPEGSAAFKPWAP
jgi:hypothetical protein